MTPRSAEAKWRASTSAISLAHHRIRIKGKGRAAREWITVPAVTADAIRAWLDVRGTAAGPVFLTLTLYGKLPARLRKRLSGHGIYKLVREYGVGKAVKMWPHGLRHSSITEAVKAAGPAGIDITEVLQFSRHARLDTLMIYRDQLRNVQGTLATAVANTVQDDATPNPDADDDRVSPRYRRYESGRLRLTLG